MIDYFALALTHGLLAIAMLRLMGRDDLEADPPPDGGTARAEARKKRRA